MTIQSRFLISTTLILLLTGFFSWLSMRVVAEGIVANWVEIYAEKQLRYDKVRTLLPLIQEVNLSKEFSKIESIKNWAKQPSNEELKERALHDAEIFRSRFSDNSFFIALRKNNHYYYSDNDEEKSGINSYRYTLDQSKPEDSWFYSIISAKKDIHLNVNPDVELGLVKLWSDVLIRDEEDILGVIGTGLDLSDFLHQMVEKQDIYSSIFFTNYEGSIQLHQREELIDYASITKQAKDKKLIFQLLDDDTSKLQLQNSFDLAKRNPNSVETITVYKDGIRKLASVSYIAEIDWFQVNFIEINHFLPWTEFSSLFVVFIISLISALIIFYILITLIVTKPLEELDDSIRALEKNKSKTPKVSRFAGSEIKRLISDYKNMSFSLLEYQNQLELKVAERTKALNTLSQLDPLTNLYNRRGIELYVQDYMKEWKEDGHSFSVITIDINDFKMVNDKYGHSIGDKVLESISDYLKRIISDKGEVSRWGGDEFVILIKEREDQPMSGIIDRLMKDSKSLKINVGDKEFNVMFSIGFSSIKEGDSFKDILNKADKNMYSMKFLDS
jgi:diguanylate cyclase (GGDEF)-like protein